MTKHVRVENADTSDHEVVVEVWEKGAAGEPDKMVDTVFLKYPTEMATRAIWGTRYLVVREVSA